MEGQVEPKIIPDGGKGWSKTQQYLTLNLHWILVKPFPPSGIILVQPFFKRLYFGPTFF
jgi:hypothetical protein